MNSELRTLVYTLSEKAYRISSEYIELSFEDNYIGWPEKIKNGCFGVDQLIAHRRVAELMGMEKALNEAVRLLSDALSRDESE